MTDLQYWRDLPNFARLPTTYAELVRLYAPRPIRNRSELARATEIIDALAGHTLNRDQEDYLDLLSTLVAAHEEETSPLHTASLRPLQALKYLLEEAGMNASELGRLLGNRELGSKVLRGERGLSLRHIAILAHHFAVKPEAFIPAVGATRSPAPRKPAARWRSASRRTVTHDR
jgi:HTH-type transcriptional regulator/antitoxin HigA